MGRYTTERVRIIPTHESLSTSGYTRGADDAGPDLLATSIGTVTCRHDDAYRRVALSPPHDHSDSACACRPGHPAASCATGCAHWRGRGSRDARRSDSSVGGAAYWRDLAHATRPARSSHHVGTVRGRAQPSVYGQRRPVGWLRSVRATTMARTGLCGDPRLAISRD